MRLDTHRRQALPRAAGAPGRHDGARALDVVVKAEQLVTQAVQDGEREVGLEVCAGTRASGAKLVDAPLRMARSGSRHERPSSWHKRPVCITARCIGPGPASPRLQPLSVACSGRRGGGTRALKLHEAIRPLVVHGHAELLDRGEGLLLAQPLLLAALQWRSTTSSYTMGLAVS